MRSASGAAVFSGPFRSSRPAFQPAGGKSAAWPLSRRLPFLGCLNSSAAGFVSLAPLLTDLTLANRKLLRGGYCWGNRRSRHRIQPQSGRLKSWALSSSLVSMSTRTTVEATDSSGRLPHKIRSGYRLARAGRRGLLNGWLQSDQLVV